MKIFSSTSTDQNIPEAKIHVLRTGCNDFKETSFNDIVSTKFLGLGDL